MTTPTATAPVSASQAASDLSGGISQTTAMNGLDHKEEEVCPQPAPAMSGAYPIPPAANSVEPTVAVAPPPKAVTPPVEVAPVPEKHEMCVEQVKEPETPVIASIPTAKQPAEALATVTPSVSLSKYFSSDMFLFV